MLTTFEKFWPLPKAQVLLTILRIFAVAWLLSVLTLLTKIAKIFAARVPRAREHHYTNFPLDLCIYWTHLGRNAICSNENVHAMCGSVWAPDPDTCRTLDETSAPRSGALR